jgi:hypothetical protein
MANHYCAEGREAGALPRIDCWILGFKQHKILVTKNAIGIQTELCLMIMSKNNSDEHELIK